MPRHAHAYGRFCCAVTVIGAFLLSIPLPQAFSGDKVSRESLPAELHFEQVWQAGPMCGPNALFFMMRLNGVPVNHAELLKHLAPPKQGSSMAELQQAARQWGLATEILQTTPSGLDRLHVPFIAHLSLPPNDAGHYLLVLRTNEDSLKTIDGTKGTLLTVRRETFLRHWSGHVLVTGRDWLGSLLRLVFWSLVVVLVVLSGLTFCLHLRKR